MPPRREVKSMPPWPHPDMSLYFKEVADPLRLYMDDADLNLEDYTTVREIIRIPVSVVLVLDETFVLKMHLNTFDVEAIVSSMRLASTVVPVPHVYKYGHSGNCSFILMEFIHGHDLETVKRSLRFYWIYVMSIVEKQIEVAVQRLADVGLSHQDLYPRNILINESWEIVAIIDWDNCTEFDPAREYMRRVENSIDDIGMRDSKVFDPAHWNSIFLRHVRDRMSLTELFEGRSKLFHYRPLLRFPRGISLPAWDPGAKKPRLITQTSEKRRIAVMTSNTVLAVQMIAEACTEEHIPQASICIVVSDIPEHSSPFKLGYPYNRTFPIIHLPLSEDVDDGWGKRWHHNDEELTRTILRERPDVIIQVGWIKGLGLPFTGLVVLPRLPTMDRRSNPIPLVWIRPALPDHNISPTDLRDPFTWAYHAFQRGDITETGFTIIRRDKGGDIIIFVLGVEIQMEEAFEVYEARMVKAQADLAVDIAKKLLEGVEPVVC